MFAISYASFGALLHCRNSYIDFRVFTAKISGVLILWIRKFSCDFYFALFSFSNYSRVLKFSSKHSFIRPFPWVEDRRSLYFIREINNVM